MIFSVVKHLLGIESNREIVLCRAFLE